MVKAAFACPLERSVEHVFADRKGRVEVFVRTIGTARAAANIRLANPASATQPPRNSPFFEPSYRRLPWRSTEYRLLAFETG